MEAENRANWAGSGAAGVGTNESGPKSAEDFEPVSKAGDRGRTDDIHVGNVTLYH
jgi:hypothetical protein